MRPVDAELWIRRRIAISVNRAQKVREIYRATYRAIGIRHTVPLLNPECFSSGIYSGTIYSQFLVAPDRV
jgi:hypothetical protein